MRQLCEKRKEEAGRRTKTLLDVRDEVFLYVYAPVLTAFVEWVLEKARREGKKRLYFLSRDGYLMYLVARRLAKERNSDIDIRYLKISRLAVCRADDHAIAYFRQEGLFDEVPYALVDSGWIGSLQLGLQRLLSYAAEKPVRLQGYYFGLYERPKGTAAKQYRHFYFGEKNIRRKLRFSNCLLEAVCSSPAGMTYGYRPVMGEETRFEAIESSGGNPNADTMERFSELLLAYVEAYLHEERRAGSGSMRQTRRTSLCMAERLLQPMMGNPTRAEAKAFGSLLFSDRISEEALQPVAAVWREDDLKKLDVFYRLLVKTGIKDGVLPESAWMEGSIVRLGRNVRKHIRQERLYKALSYLRKVVCR